MKEFKSIKKEVEEYELLRNDLEKLICEGLKLNIKELNACTITWDLTENGKGVIGVLIKTEKIIRDN